MRNVSTMGGPFAIGFTVVLGLLCIWQLTKGQTDQLALAVVQNVQLHGAARCEAPNDAGEFTGILNRLTICPSNDVACLDAGLCCRPILLGVSYQRTLRLLQTHSVCDVLRYRLNLNTDPTTADASLILQLSDHVLYSHRRDRKCDAHTAAGRRIDRCVYADDLALHIEGWTTRIALVNGRVDLNEIVVMTTSDVTAASRNDAGGYGATEPKRVADCKYPITHPGVTRRKLRK